MNDFELYEVNNINLDNFIDLPIKFEGSSEKVILENRFNRNMYMVKFEKYDKKSNSPYNDYIAEYISSNLIRYLGYESQEAYLVKYKDINSVAVKLFDFDLFELSDKNNYFYSMEENYLDIDKIFLEYREHRYKNKIDEKLFNEFLIKMLLIDYIIVNMDRHTGNIGFREINNKLIPAPFYDSGASLLTRYFFNNYTEVIKNHKLMNYKIRYKEKQINFEKLLELLSLKSDSIDYKNEIEYIIKNYNKNLDNINKIIDTVKLIDKRYLEKTEEIKLLINITINELKDIINKNNDELLWN